MELMRLYGDKVLSVIDYLDFAIIINLDEGEAVRLNDYRDPLGELLELIEKNNTDRIECSQPFLGLDEVLETIDNLKLNINIELLKYCIN